MKFSQLLQYLIIISPLGFLLSQPVVANEIQQKAKTSQLEILAKPSTHAADLLALSAAQNKGLRLVRVNASLHFKE